VARHLLRNSKGKWDFWGQFLISTLGAKCDPKGEPYPVGGKTLCSSLRFSKQYRVFTPGGQVQDPGAKFTPLANSCYYKPASGPEIRP
jgi:hypothetical protein